MLLYCYTEKTALFEPLFPALSLRFLLPMFFPFGFIFFIYLSDLSLFVCSTLSSLLFSSLTLLAQKIIIFRTAPSCWFVHSPGLVLCSLYCYNFFAMQLFFLHISPKHWYLSTILLTFTSRRL